MTGMKRQMLVGMAGVVVSVAVLTGCTTGCDRGSPAPKAVGAVQGGGLAASTGSTCEGPGPELLSVWERLLEAVWG